MANNKYTYIRIDNRGIPTEGERMSYSGKYESDYSQIARAVMSATEGKARQLAYNVTSRGTSDTIFALPSLYKKQVESAVIKEIQKIQNNTEWSNKGKKEEEPLNPPIYEIHATKQAIELPFVKTSKSAKARALYSAIAKKRGVLNLLKTPNSVAGLMPVTKENFNPALISKSGTFNGKEITFSSFLASKDMQGEYLKNLFASGDTVDKKEAEEKKKKDEEKKEKEKEKDKKDKKRNLLKILALIAGIFTVIKRIFNALMDTAVQRQALSQSGLPLGYTASEMERFARFERRMSIPEGSIKGTAQAIQSIGANWATISDNKESLTQLLRALALSGNEASVDTVTKAFTDLASGKTDVNSVLNTLFKSVAGNWLAKGATQKDYESTVELLKQGGYGDLADIFTAFAMHYNKADVETKNKMKTFDLSEWIDFSTVSVPDDFVQYEANEALLQLKQLLEAWKEAIKIDVIAEFFTLLGKLNFDLKRWLSFRAKEKEVETDILEDSTNEETGEVSLVEGMKKYLRGEDSDFTKSGVGGAYESIKGGAVSDEWWKSNQGAEIQRLEKAEAEAKAKNEQKKKEVSKIEKDLRKAKSDLESTKKKEEKGKKVKKSSDVIAKEIETLQLQLASAQGEADVSEEEYNRVKADLKEAKDLFAEMWDLINFVQSPFSSIKDYYRKYVEKIDKKDPESVQRYNEWLEKHGFGENEKIKVLSGKVSFLPSELYPESSAGGNTTHTLVINVNDSKGERTIASLPLDGVQYQLGKTQLELSQDSRGYEFVQIAGVV